VNDGDLGVVGYEYNSTIVLHAQSDHGIKPGDRVQFDGTRSSFRFSLAFLYKIGR